MNNSTINYVSNLGVQGLLVLWLIETTRPNSTGHLMLSDFWKSMVPRLTLESVLQEFPPQFYPYQPSLDQNKLCTVIQQCINRDVNVYGVETVFWTSALEIMAENDWSDWHSLLDAIDNTKAIGRTPITGSYVEYRQKFKGATEYIFKLFESVEEHRRGEGVNHDLIETE